MAPIGTPLMFPVARARHSYLSSPTACVENSRRPQRLLSVGLSTHSTKNPVQPLGGEWRAWQGDRLPAVGATLVVARFAHGVPLTGLAKRVMPEPSPRSQVHYRATTRVAPTGVVVSQSAGHFLAVSDRELATQFHFS